MIHIVKQDEIVFRYLKPEPLNSTVCDMNYLISVTHGNKKVIKSIVTVFFEETQRELLVLKTAIAEANYSIITSVSHKLKSAFLLMGITILKPVFDEMEALGTASSGIEKLKQLGFKINMVFNQAKKEIKF